MTPQPYYEDAAHCQHCPNLADERSFMCEDCASQADAEADDLREQFRGAIYLTDTERDRVIWWLERPVPPGPMKELDEAIIRKITRRVAET